jgi:nicotinamide-nucleotide amidase
MIRNPPTEKELHFALLSETAFDPLLKEWKKKSSLEIGVYPQCGYVTIRVQGSFQELGLFIDDVKKQFAPNLYSEKDPRLEVAFHEKMISSHKTFALAESCTGGRFASRLTALAGSSLYFLGGIVTYSDQMKVDFLGVSKELLRKEGAVSAECVKEMAQGLLKRVSTDYVVAISGIAGPEGGSADKPVGTVWICYGSKGNLQVYLLPILQNLPRLVLIDYAINSVLGKLLTGGLL